MKITMEGIDNVLDIAKVKTSKLEKTKVGITQNKLQS